jgi:hypothetical protein
MPLDFAEMPLQELQPQMQLGTTSVEAGKSSWQEHKSAIWHVGRCFRVVLEKKL